MNEFILSLIKYTSIFTCVLYAFTKLLRIKLKVWDLFDIPIVIALSAALYFVTVYIKILVPLGLLVCSIIFLLLRFRKTFYETVTVGTIALGLSIFLLLLSFFIAIPITLNLNFIKNENLRMILAQISVSIIQILFVFLLFKIKRLQSGVNPKGENGTFEILLLFSVGCILSLMIVYTKNVTQSIYETVLLIIALFGLLLIVWWRKHIMFNYRETVKQQNVDRMENTIDEYKLSSVENDYQVALYAKLFHYLNKAIPDCALLVERVAAQTGCPDACAARDMLQRISQTMNVACEKCSLKNIPQTGVGIIDAPIIQLFAAAERKNLNVSADISADVESWFTDIGLQKEDIHILLSYLLDNAVISALGSQNAGVRLELSATESKEPQIRIYDSGEQFDEEVLAKLGLEQVTTRTNVGGNGIGLFTVFEILKKYSASFALDEAPQLSGFTKVIEIAFDGCNSVTVRTCRASVVEVCAARKGFTVELIETEEVLRDGTNG